RIRDLRRRPAARGRRGVRRVTFLRGLTDRGCAAPPPFAHVLPPFRPHRPWLRRRLDRGCAVPPSLAVRYRAPRARAFASRGMAGDGAPGYAPPAVTASGPLFRRSAAGIPSSEEAPGAAVCPDAAALDVPAPAEQAASPVSMSSVPAGKPT